MDRSDMIEPGTVALRRSIDEAIAIADRMGLSLVAIWLEHARQELGPRADIDLVEAD